jgi:succinylarginine dihydrolase
MRLGPSHGHPGIELFVYGRDGNDHAAGSRFPGRQSLAASEAVARLHGFDSSRVLFLRQSAAALDAGVFHNDVIAVANENVLLVHEQAYENGPEAIAAIRTCFASAFGDEPVIVEVSADEVPLDTAVDTYLFNSQLVTLPGGGMALVCPIECHEHPLTRRWLDRLVTADNPVVAVHPVAVRQSMKNGGGPACLRLRVVLEPDALAAMHQGVLVCPALLDALEACVCRHYRERLTLEDLADPALLAESRQAVSELTHLLGLSIRP